MARKKRRLARKPRQGSSQSGAAGNPTNAAAEAKADVEADSAQETSILDDQASPQVASFDEQGSKLDSEVELSEQSDGVMADGSSTTPADGDGDSGSDEINSLDDEFQGDLMEAPENASETSPHNSESSEAARVAENLEEGAQELAPIAEEAASSLGEESPAEELELHAADTLSEKQLAAEDGSESDQDQDAFAEERVAADSESDSNQDQDAFAEEREAAEDGSDPDQDQDAFAEEHVAADSESDPDQDQDAFAEERVAAEDGSESDQDQDAFAEEHVAADSESDSDQDQDASSGAVVVDITGTGVELDETEIEDTEAFLKGLLESILYVSDKPLSAREVARAARIDTIRAQELLEMIRDETAPRGVRLVEISDGWSFRSNPAYSDYVREFLAQRPVRLSRAQLESLAIIAYRQPITRPEVDDIRGVDSGAVMKVLLERELIRILGKKDEPGRPMIYGTSPQFLDLFSLKSLRDLPTLQEFTELNEDSRTKFELEIGQPAPEGREATEELVNLDAPVIDENTDENTPRDSSAEPDAESSAENPAVTDDSLVSDQEELNAQEEISAGEDGDDDVAGQEDEFQSSDMNTQEPSAATDSSDAADPAEGSDSSHSQSGSEAELNLADEDEFPDDEDDDDDEDEDEDDED